MTPTSPDTVPLGFGRSVAVVIGINAYSHGLQPLQNAVRDASALGDTLESQGFEVIRRLDAEACLSALSDLVTHQLPALEPVPDRLLIYFAGHGLAHTDERHALSGFLLPADACRDEPSSYWPMDSLREALGRLTCRHLLLVLDCCFAGAFPRSASRDIRPPESLAPPLFIERFRHFTSHRSFQLLLSAAHDELASDRLLSRYSQESQGNGLHSPFAHALLEALRYPSPADFNQDGLVTASELYVSLRSHLIDSHSQQTPSLWHLDWHDRGEFLFLLGGRFPELEPAPPLSKDSNPYLGLSPYSAEQSHLFFGRERMVEDLLQRLPSQPLLLLYAPSGAGKSSLVHAGLLPRLGTRASWAAPAPLRPSSQPLQALSAWLSALSPSPPTAEELSSQPRLAATWVEDHLAGNCSHSLLLVIDPLEELVTACLDNSVRQSFLEALSSLLESAISNPRLRLLLLLRSDFEPYLSSLLAPSSALADHWSGSRFLLPRMNRDELRRCIEKPAEYHTLFFSQDLVERLLDEVEQMPGALPLLSVTLSELFDAYMDDHINKDRRDRTLTMQEYEKIGGGTAGALKRRADLVYSGSESGEVGGRPLSAPAASEELLAYQRTLYNVLLRMISYEGAEPARRRVLRTELKYPDPEEDARIDRALQALERARLVVADSALAAKGQPAPAQDQGETSNEDKRSFEPAHDALLSAWDRLHRWAVQARNDLPRLRRISAAAAEWQHQRRAAAQAKSGLQVLRSLTALVHDWKRQRHIADLLWADSRLEAHGLSPDYLLRSKEPLALTPPAQDADPAAVLRFNAEESDFLLASAARRQFLRRRNSVIIIAIFAVLTTLAIRASIEAERANDNAVEARKQKEAAEANARLTHAQRLQDLDPTKALLILRKGLDQGVPLRGPMLQTAMDISQQAISSMIMQAHDRTIRTALFSPDGDRVLTVSQGGTARIESTEGSAPPITIGDLQSGVVEAVFSPDGTFVLAGYTDGTVKLWRVEGLTPPVEFKGHELPVRAVSFNSDGTRFLTVSDDGTARLWRVDDARHNTLLGVAEGRTQAATFSPVGPHILTITKDGTASLWLMGDTGASLTLKGEMKGVEWATFSPDGSRLLVITQQGAASLWRVDGVGPPVVLTNSRMSVKQALFSPDGSRALLSIGNQLIHFELGNRAGGSVALRAHGAPISHAIFSPDGSRVLGASENGTVYLWNPSGTAPLLQFKGHAEPVSIAKFSPDGSYILTASRDGAVRLWRSDDNSSFISLKGHTQEATSATFSRDGSLVLTASRDGTSRIWRVEGRGSSSSLAEHMRGINLLSFSPDGVHILASYSDGIARLWRADGKGGIHTLRGHSKTITSLAFSQDGNFVLTASADRTTRIWRTVTGGMVSVLKVHTDPVTFATFTPVSLNVLTAVKSGSIQLWDANGAIQLANLEGHIAPIRSASFSANGSRLLTTSDDATVRLWYTDGRSASFKVNGHRHPTSLPEFSPDGSRILMASRNGSVQICKTDDLVACRVLMHEDIDVLSVDLSADGSRVSALTSNGEVRVWQMDGSLDPVVLKSEKIVVISALLSPDGSRVVTLSAQGKVHVWQIDMPSVPLEFSDHSEPVRHISLSSGDVRGLRVLTVTQDGAAHIWYIDDRGHFAITLEQEDVVEAYFLPGGHYAATISKERTLRIWPVEHDSIRDHFLNATRVCLSVSERERYLLEMPDEAVNGYRRCGVERIP